MGGGPSIFDDAGEPAETRPTPTDGSVFVTLTRRFEPRPNWCACADQPPDRRDASRTQPDGDPAAMTVFAGDEQFELVLDE
jgi:hypothetical protein